MTQEEAGDELEKAVDRLLDSRWLIYSCEL